MCMAQAGLTYTERLLFTEEAVVDEYILEDMVIINTLILCSP